MGLLSQTQMSAIKATAVKSNQDLKPSKKVNTKSVTREIASISEKVSEYFKDSNAILITSVDQLHEYITNCIESKYISIDTETTGLDRINDTIVGVCLYYPGGVEAYVPSKHKAPIVETFYKNQLTYEEIGKELQRVVDTGNCHSGGTKAIFANADFDLSMMYKDLKVDFCNNCYYDVILSWRCLKENELHNGLKQLYSKYCLKGKGDPKKFSDFFSPQLFPYCKPDIAKLYAANDALITFKLFQFQLPYVTPDSPKCKKNHLEDIANIVWNIEFPLIKVCQMMHRRGVYLEPSIADRLNVKYDRVYDEELTKLQKMVQEVIDDPKYSSSSKRPFASGKQFSPTSITHVEYLLYKMLKLPGSGTSKATLDAFNLPITKQIMLVRSIATNINTFVKKLPNAVAKDQKIHCTFSSVGASTGRFSSQNPNMQNIPSKLKDIRHMFRATPETTYDVPFTNTENISVCLPKYHMLTTDSGDKFVRNIKVGDKVQFKEEGKVIYKIVKSIEPSSEDTSLCNVVF